MDKVQLRTWLETQWENNQELADEELWSNEINNNIPTWAG